MPENTLYYGDNLPILRNRDYFPNECVDLIYLDPPFNSKAEYNVLYAESDGSRAASQITAFEDTWQWDESAVATYQEFVRTGPAKAADALEAFHKLFSSSRTGGNAMLAYLTMMAPRLVELHRVLKPTGSLYLHCDPTASHYLKVLLDAIFGSVNFRNELLWCYGGRGAKAIAKQFPRNHDIILFYSKHFGRHCYRRQYVTRRYTHEEARRRGFRQDDKGRWFKTAPRGDYTDDSVAKLEAEGRIHRTRTDSIRIKYFLEADAGSVSEEALIGDTWADIGDAMHMGRENLGYPTQKPEALLRRIIEASSDEGMLVLDPFCGCGTTIIAAHRLGRRWIGIDITHLAIGLMKRRLRDTFGEDAVPKRVIGEPASVQDAAALAEQDRYQFQFWAVDKAGGHALERKKGADKGIDGVVRFHDDASGETKRIILSVKSGNVTAAHVRDLAGVIQHEGAQMGVLITLQEPTLPMRTFAAGEGTYDTQWGSHPRIQILTVADLLAGKGIDAPPLDQPGVTFKKAPRARQSPGEKQTELGGSQYTQD